MSDEPIELRMSNGRMAFGDVPEQIDDLLQEAVKARDVPDACEALLWEAHRKGPRVLPVFSAKLSAYAEAELRKLGVEVRTLVAFDGH